METKTENQVPEKLSYEQLEQVADQLSQQLNQTYAKIQQMHMENMFKRLDYLFKVVESSYTFNMTFVDKCKSEIEELMTIPETEIKE